MNGEYLADTSVVVDLLRFGESPIVPKGAEILICATVLGELYYGALISARPQKQISQLHRRLEQAEHLVGNEEASAGRLILPVPSATTALTLPAVARASPAATRPH
jgi:predicted nucleic acid-binding protein